MNLILRNLFLILFLMVLGGLEARSVRGVDVDSFDLDDDWSALSIAQQRLLAPYFMESVYLQKNGSRAKNFIKLHASATDLVLNTYSKIASIYFENDTAAMRLKSLNELRNDQTAIARYLIDYFIGIESNNSSRRSSICRVPDQQILCQWEKFEKKLLLGVRTGKFEMKQLEDLVFSAREFLRKGGAYVPFTSDRLITYCDYLYKMGLPLEAAIVAERFTFQNEHVMARKLRAKIPFYLAGAGDFRSAAEFSFSLGGDDDQVLNNARLEWMILGKDYTKAINYMNKITPEKLGSGEISKHRDIFSGFYYSRDSMRLRSAMLLYINRDPKTAAVALKRLTEIEGDIDGVPARYYARLRLAQILLEDDPGLSHKIAEDLSYLAQAKGWYILEYYATVMDGWALYYANNHYAALINFIKARGILPASKRRFYLHYTHTLGHLAVSQKMKPWGNYDALIKTISDKLASEPENDAMLVIREWAPIGAGPDFFRNLAVNHWNQKKQFSHSIQFLSSYRNYQRSFFLSGHNPGGSRGYISSTSWIQKMEEFSTTRILAQGLSLNKNAQMLALQSMDQARQNTLNINQLSGKYAYLFGFALEDSWKLYLVYPSRTSVLVGKKKGKKIYKTSYGFAYSLIHLDQSQMERLGSKCEVDEKICDPGDLKEFASLLENFPGKRLNILYNASMNLNLQALLLSKRKDISPVYFLRPQLSTSNYQKIKTTLLKPDSCEPFLEAGDSRSYNLIRSFFFFNRDKNSVYIWPEGVDSNKSRSGKQRPVYLRNFHCGNTQLRLWDMDRFSGSKGAGLIIYAKRNSDEFLDDAFAEYFMERDTALIELPNNGHKKSFESWLKSIANSPGMDIFDEYEELLKKDSRVKLIVPAIYK